jgi:hypothetical protein
VRIRRIIEDPQMYQQSNSNHQQMQQHQGFPGSFPNNQVESNVINPSSGTQGVTFSAFDINTICN